MRIEATRSFYQRHHGWLAIQLGFVVGAAIAGLLIAGLLGVACGVILGLIAALVVPSFRERVREVERQ